MRITLASNSFVTSVTGIASGQTNCTQTLIIYIVSILFGNVYSVVAYPLIIHALIDRHFAVGGSEGGHCQTEQCWRAINLKSNWNNGSIFDKCLSMFMRNIYNCWILVDNMLSYKIRIMKKINRQKYSIFNTCYMND